MLLKLKQICNHPAQFQGTDDYAPERSGKFLRLQELCASIAARQEKAILFTQFRSIIPHLHDLLSGVFGRSGLTLHGGTPIPERQNIVTAFQKESGPPFCILSLKAAGTGLNLTRADHVIHLDRWWNPAVEEQATDRAYRIGQTRPVQVHRMITRGTVEERIADLLGRKRQLADAVLARTPAPTTYARIDLVEFDGAPALMEAELIEPELFLGATPEAATNFARVLAGMV